MHDFLAESSLIGSLLLSPTETMPIARSIVRADDILDERYRAVFIAVCELTDANKTVDPVTVLEQTKRHTQSVDSKMLLRCMDEVCTAANIRVYAESVHSNSIRRNIQELGTELAEDSPLTPQEILRSAISRLQELQTGSSTRPEEPADVANAFFNELSEAAAGIRKPFISTGFSKLDELLGGGLAASGLITLAARTGIGKTTAALNIADNVAQAGNPVLYFSLEMSKSQIMARRVGRYAGLSYNKLQRGDIEKDDHSTWKRVSDTLSVLSQRPLYISDTPVTISDIELKARSIPGLSLIVVDHMGLIRSENLRANLVQQTTETSHSLKMLALSLGVPILSLCQLNRESEGRSDHRPELAELRNSGAIEEDSDAVLLLHRPAAYFPEVDKPKPWEEQKLEIIAAKNRHGTTGSETFSFYGLTNRIME